jgi:hypothetical protein
MDNKIINIIKEEPFVGVDGKNYVTITKEILTPRKTFIKGTISGKYRGDKLPFDYDKSDLYDFSIYEAEVLCNSIDDFSKNKPFVFPNDFKNIDNCNKIRGKVFPKSKLPEILPVIISANSENFPINVLEPKLYEFEIIRKYHQTEGDEVFGMFNAFITGYVFDYEREEIEEIIEVIEAEVIIEETKICQCSNIETGKLETKGKYIRKEYKCKNHYDNVWGEWEYKDPIKTASPIAQDYSGCLPNLFSIIGIILLGWFIISVLPVVLYFVGFYLIILLIGLLAPYLKWIFRAIGAFLLIMFVSSLFNAFKHSATRYNPPPIVQDTEQEQVENRKPIVDNSTPERENQGVEKDTLIKKYRIWRDYDGNTYEGYYTLFLSNVKQAHRFKNNLSFTPSNKDIYDEIVFNLKQNDKNKLNGVYEMFDSIQLKNQLSNIKFAEMMVSFVQDIPYVLILEDDCNPNLYNDSFTRKYLSSPNAKCSGYQRFGINTPIEFLYSLNGDCDTRTLLLYTMLSHYDYDVALLSSELYQHSILGVNIPVNGLAYKYQNQRYVLWETTAKDIRPGLIQNDFSNTNNWRISLKSK